MSRAQEVGLSFSGLPIVLDSAVPLRRARLPDEPGEGEVDVLCYRIGDTLVFHPDRWATVESIVREVADP